MASVFKFNVKTELTMSEEDGVVSLTKRLNLWQTLKSKWMENVQLSNINFSFESRGGPLAEGRVTASVHDNRISDDTSDNTLKSVTFSVTQDISFSWNYNVNFEVDSLRHERESPLILVTKISECNMRPGYSLGQIRVQIEMTTSDKMIRRISKSPVIKLFRDHKMSENERLGRRTSIERLEAAQNKPLTIKEGPQGPYMELDRSNSVMNIPRTKYYVAAPAKEI
nr:P3 protein [Tomato yellow mottle-associated virus]UNG40239.1 P3 protein [Tomato yellow mottle-associated virus]UNG40245.1 P3 protein [Tomato yellow mottle-associated virus]